MSPKLSVLLATGAACCCLVDPFCLMGQGSAVVNPNALRPPLVTSADSVSAARTAVFLKIVAIDQAVGVGDTVSLSALIPAEAILESESQNARLSGCASVGAAVQHIGAGRRAGVAVPRPLLDLTRVIFGGTGSDSLTVVARPVRSLAAADTTLRVEFGFAKDGKAYRLTRVTGLLLFLCRL